MPMPEFSARLTIQVEERDSRGVAQSLTVDFALVSHASSVAEAALDMARAASMQIGAQLNTEAESDGDS